MKAQFFKKVKNRDLFIYVISGEERLINEYINFLGQHHRSTDDGQPLFFTKRFFGKERPFVNIKGKYMIDIKDLFFLEREFSAKQHNMWSIIDHCLSNHTKPEKADKIWSINRELNSRFNCNVHKLDTNLKNKLFKILASYKIEIAEHSKLNPEELEEYRWKEEEDEEIMREILREGAKDAEIDKYFSRINNYNDNLDMDQQSQEFWDQW